MNLYKKDVIKHSAAIQISNKINLLDRRAWNVLLANAFDDMAEKDEFKISINDLAQILKYDSNDIQNLKDILYKLVDTTVEWNLLGKDKQQGWGVFSLLAEAHIINGYCYYSYGARLRQRLHNPSMYARISLSLQNQFKGKYSLALFELFLDYFQIDKGYGETQWIPLEKFRELVGLEPDEYKQFKTLNHYVIKQPIKEINAISDLHIDEKKGILTQKEGRKVIALKFIILKNKDNVIDIEAIEKEQCPDQSCLPIPEFEIENQELLQSLTIEFNIPNKLAIQILQNQDESQINKTVDEIRKKVELSDNILSGSDLALKAFFPQEKKKQIPPVDEIEKKLKEISYHAFKKVRKLHSDEVLLDALKELDFEIARRKQTGIKIDNLGGWLNSRLPEAGEPYQFSSAYQKNLETETEQKQAQAKREQEEIRNAEALKQQEEKHKVLNELVDARIEELKRNPDEWDALNHEALQKAQSRIFPPDQTKEINDLAERKIKALSENELEKLEKEAFEYTQVALASLNIDSTKPAFQRVKENKKVELIKLQYTQEFNHSLHTTPAYLNYNQKISKQTEFEIRALVRKKFDIK